jgi:glycosyltransferase involved in cell wall biosynthesis
MSLRTFVIVPSVGRAETLAFTVARLAQQTRVPDGVLVVSVVPGDVRGVAEAAAAAGLEVEIHFAARGLPRQRNAGLRLVAGRADIVTFFDDDFLPAPGYLAAVEALFDERPEVVGATGRIIDDGVGKGGLTIDEGLAAIARDGAVPGTHDRPMPALYGCNLSIRLAAAEGLWFDEALPLYGWQEDVDFSFRLGARGLLLLTDRFAGVHLGISGGRTSGKRLGYSQVANPVYLLRKGSIPPRLAWRLMRRNLAANMLKSLRPEPMVDRRGRLVGNMLAIGDLVSGRLHPTRIEAL